MREIKFRAWDKVNGKTLNYGTDEACEVWEDGCDYMGMSFITHQPNIIWMQYTGLKDKNGKEIYENDLVKDKVGRTFKVAYNEFCAFMLYPIDGNDFMAIYPGIELVVVGNVFEDGESNV